MFSLVMQHDIASLMLEVTVSVSHHCHSLISAGCHHGNILMFMGEQTGGTLAYPAFSICCKSGLIHIPKVTYLTDELH